VVVNSARILRFPTPPAPTASGPGDAEPTIAEGDDA